MEKIINLKKLAVNYLSDDMLQCAIEKGYKIPCISVKKHYGKPAIFYANYKNGKVQNYELNVLDEKGNNEEIYLIPA